MKDWHREHELDNRTLLLIQRDEDLANRIDIVEEKLMYLMTNPDEKKERKTFGGERNGEN